MSRPNPLQAPDPSPKLIFSKAAAMPAEKPAIPLEVFANLMRSKDTLETRQDFYVFVEHTLGINARKFVEQYDEVQEEHIEKYRTTEEEDKIEDKIAVFLRGVYGIAANPFIEEIRKNRRCSPCKHCMKDKADHDAQQQPRDRSRSAPAI